MKTTEAVLADFIRDFKLELPGSGVYFNADIEFAASSFFKKFNCEVHIITMIQKQMSIVYLLHRELSELGIPDTFPYNADNFFYHKKKALIITDYDLLRGKYTLSITPINTKGIKKPGKELNVDLG